MKRTDSPALIDALVDGVPAESRKTYDQGVPKDKTPEERKLIETALHNNSYFTCLDEEQISRFVEKCRLLEFDEGEVLFAQGERGSDYFIIDQGEAEVSDTLTDGSVEVLVRRKPGSSVGDGSMVFHRRRSATVKAVTKMRCWVVNDKVFVNYILHSQRLKKLFDKYASLVDETGEKVMTMDDFVRSCNDNAVIDVIKYSQLRSLYRIFRGDRQFVRLRDFAMFNMFMTRPDPEYDIAFLLFDRNKQGYLSIDDVAAFLEKQATTPDHKFDYTCDLFKRFFGTTARKRVRVQEFSQFFHMLQNEIAQQSFVQKDPLGTGMVSVQDFLGLLSGFGRRQLPESLVQRIKEIHLHRNVPFTEFLAFQSILADLPSLCTTINTATEVKSGPLSKDDFKVATRVLNRAFSRVEADLVFDLFDTDEDGFISPDDCRRVLGVNYIKDLKAIVGRGGAITFAPPPGYTLEKTRHLHREMEKARPKEPKTFQGMVREFVESFLLGAIAGGVGSFAVYPIDLVKTRMQNQRSGKSLPHAPTYKGNLDCFRKVLANEGLVGLYRGLVPQLVGVAPEKAIKLTVNDMLRDMFTNRDKVTGEHSIYFPLEVLAGCGAGASQVVFTNPLEITKIRLQMQGETQQLLKAQGLPVPQPRTALQIVKELGVVGLYKGAGACFLRDIPFSGIYFPAYAAAKKWIAGDDEQIRPHHLLIAGAIAGIPAASLTTPADVIKTRLQVVAREGEVTYNGITDCGLKIYQQEGFGALFKGALMRVMRSSPQFGVTLLAYEGLRMLFASDIEPRPPTNAPVTHADYDAFRRADLSHKVSSVAGLIRTSTAADSQQ